MEYRSEKTEQQKNQDQSDGNMDIDCGAGSPNSEDFTLSGLLNFEGLIEPSSPLSADLLFSSISYSSLNPMFGNCVSLTFPGDLEQARDSIKEDEETSSSGYSRFSEMLAAQKPKPNFVPEFSPSSSREVEFGLDIHDSQLDSVDTVKWTSSTVLKSLGGFTFSDRMLKVLSLLKNSSGGGILAQVWMPVKQGDSHMLSTCEQPFLLDQVLAGYREVSSGFTFSTKQTAGLFPGVPGRVFMSGLPEWTSNVIYYNKYEYLRVDYAVNHEVRGSLAVPIFYPNKSECFAVLELVTMKEMSNFYIELENVSRALQDVDLRITNVQSHYQNLTTDQKSALSEILNILKAVCHAHMLPLALAWMPMAQDSELVSDDCNTSICKSKRFIKETMLCIQESACYVNDTQMHGFLRACAEHNLAKGQGIAGKAYQSNLPFFSPDVKGYDIGEYPLAHHARKYGLHAAVAIRLRSTYTGDDDFILEFFLPVNCKGSAEQQLLLNNLSVTMQRLCRSLRTVLDDEAARPLVNKVDIPNMEEKNHQSSEITARNTQPMYKRNSQSNCENMESDEQVKHDLQKPKDKKRVTAVKHISLNVLQKYFAGSLKNAAISLGVCPTTLKRICRQHGISRWPSRKIKKVNHSLKKIQCVINSVQGAEGTFKYDPENGYLIATVNPENFSLQSTNDDCKERQFDEHLAPSNNKIGDERVIDRLPINDLSTDFTTTSSKLGFSRHADVQSSDTRSLRVEDSTDMTGIRTIMQVSSDSAPEEDGMDFRTDLNVGKEHSHLSGSSMTNSGESASSSQFFKESSKKEAFVTKKGATFVVKATYKADIVRFKLLSSMGFLQLYEEIGKRFKLYTGKFKLKYMDDEEEWVMLTDDSDLQECIEVLESTSSSCIRLQVRDVLRQDEARNLN